MKKTNSDMFKRLELFTILPLLISLLTLISWIPGIRQISLTSVLFYGLPPVYAIIFLLLSSALFVVNRFQKKSLSNWYAVGSVILASLLCLFELFRNSEISTGSMSPFVAFVFLFTLIAFLLTVNPIQKSKLVRQIASLLTTAMIIISIFVIGSFVMDIPFSYNNGIVVLPFVTTVIFFMIGVAILLRTGDDTFPRYLFREFSHPEVSNREIKKRSAVVFIVIAGIIAVGVVAYLRQQIITSRKRAEQELKVIVDLKASQIAEWYSSNMNEAEDIYQNTLLSEKVTSFFANPRPDIDKTVIQNWMFKRQELYGSKRIVLFDNTGLIRIAVPPAIETEELLDKSMVKKALTEEKITTIDLHRDEKTSDTIKGGIHQSIWIPILSGSVTNTKVEGIWLVQLDPYKYLYPLLQSWPFPSRTAESLLFRVEGKDIVYLSELKYLTQSALSLRYPIDKNPELVAAKAARGKAGITEGVDYRHVRVLAAISKVKDTPWFIIAKIDRNEVYGPLQQRVVSLGLVLIILVVAVAFGIKIQEHKRGLQVSLGTAREWNNTFDAVADVIWLLDKEHTILRTNNSVKNMFGLQPEDVIGKHCWDVVHNTLEPIPECPILKMRATGKSADAEIKEGDNWYSISVDPVVSLNGEVTGAVHIIKDITAKKFEEEAFKAVQRENTLLADLLYSSAQPFAIIYPGGRISQSNLAFHNLIGCNEGECNVWANINDLIAPESVETDDRNVEELVRTGKPVRYEIEYLRKDGSRVPVEIFLHLVKDADGNPDYYYSFATDISEHKKANKILRESEERFRKIAESAEEWIWEVDKNGLYTFCSTAVEQIMGYKPEELVGIKHFYELSTPEEMESLKKNALQAFTDKIEIHGLINHNLHKNGSLVILKTSGVPTLNDDGSLKGFLGVDVEITEQQNYQKTLKAVTDRLLLATSSARIGIWEYDIVNKIPIWDETVHQLLEIQPGMDIDYLVAWRKKVHPDDLPEQDRLHKLAIAGDDKIDSIYRITLNDGSLRYIKIDAVVQRDEAGKPLWLLGTNYDVSMIKQAETEIRELNEQLEQKVMERTARLEAINKELEAFSYSVSHDLRTPLRTIDGWSLALAEEYHDQLGEKGQKYIDRVREGAQKMGELIEAILKLSHVTRTGILCKEVNLSNIACDVANNLQKEYPLRKVTFTIQPDLIASGDPKLLEVVLVNLMNNAWKFTSKTKEARIEFGLKLIDDEYQYYLKDNGAGFEMSYASKLFGAFQRLHNEKEFPGTGIGLATVQRIINRHNGTIRAESEVNNGATFYFTIKEA